MVWGNCGRTLRLTLPSCVFLLLAATCAPRFCVAPLKYCALDARVAQCACALRVVCLERKPRTARRTCTCFSIVLPCTCTSTLCTHSVTRYAHVRLASVLRMTTSRSMFRLEIEGALFAESSKGVHCLHISSLLRRLKA